MLKSLRFGKSESELEVVLFDSAFASMIEP